VSLLLLQDLYKIYNVRTHINKIHRKKSKLEEMVIDEKVREQTVEKIEVELTIMLSKS